MNRQEMREYVRIVLAETKEDFYKDTEINSQINAACLKIASETLCNLTLRDIETVVGQQRYALPPDMLALKDIQIIEGTVTDTVAQPGSNTWPLQVLSYDKFQARNVTVYQGRPSVYRVEFGATELSNPVPGEIWLLPIPDKVYTLRRVFYQKPTAMTDDGDTTELAESAHETVCFRAAMILSRKSKDRALIAELAALYNEHLATVKKLFSMQDSTGPKHVRNVYGRC